MIVECCNYSVRDGWAITVPPSFGLVLHRSVALKGLLCTCLFAVFGHVVVVVVVVVFDIVRVALL